MCVVAIGWLYVAVMAAIAEGMSPQGTLMGAFMTLLGWGVLPLALVLYIVDMPARKRRRRAREAQQDDSHGEKNPLNKNTDSMG